MTVSLNNNFLLNARGFILEDGGGITWAIDKTTNKITATAGSSGTATTAANLAAGAAGSIPYQTAAGATTFVAAGSTGNLLTISSGLPVWEAVPTWNQNTTGTAASLAGGVAGSISYQTAAGTTTFLAIGAAGKYLTVNAGATAPQWSTLPSIPASANPSVSIGLTAVNGTAVTWMTSDSAPALSQAIIPTWSGAHTWTSTMAASGSPLTSAVTRVATGLVGLKAALSMSSSSALATDAALTLTFNETGWYEFEIFLMFFEATSGTGGFQFNVNGGGSGGSANYRYTVEGFSTAALALVAGQTGNAAFSQATISTSSTSPSWYRAKGVFQVTSPGTFGVQWAQASTLALDPTTLMAGSFYEAIKIG